MFYYGKTQPRAALLAGTALINAIESFKEKRQLLSTDTFSVIFKADRNFLFRVFEQGNIDILTFGIGNGVLCKVAENRAYQRCISFYFNQLVKICMQCQAFIFRHHIQALGNLIYYFVDSNMFLADECTSVFHSGNERYLIQEAT